MAFINKMDRTGADFSAAVASMKEKLNASPLIIQMPVGAEDQFAGVVDLITMEQIVWNDETLGAEYELKAIDPAYLDQAREYRESLLEILSETNDEIMEKYLGEEEILEQEIRDAIRKATIARELVPVLCGSALKNKGIQPLLDAIGLYLPSPVDIDAVQESIRIPRKLLNVRPGKMHRLPH